MAICMKNSVPDLQIQKKCPKCGKRLASIASGGGTLTGWLFGSQQCQCFLNPSADQSLADNQDEQPSEVKIVEGSYSVGDLIGDRYEIIAHIGSGGMGEVYRVLDRATRSVYALKIIAAALANDKTAARRLEHEARAARTLTHGNIVSVYDVGTAASGAPYLIMDCIDGESLENTLKVAGLLNPMRALLLFIQIAEALEHAHLKGIVHRDLKPSNILLTKTNGGEDLVKIVDFGIAKLADKPGVEKTKLTQTGELIGTPLYMSPEQCRGDELDARSDIYSFGCIMYEALSGHPPFTGENPVRVILKHLSDEPAPLPSASNLKPDLKEVIARCLEKDPAERYQSAHELRMELQHVLDGKPIAKRKRKTPATNKRRLALASAVCGLLLASGAVLVAFLSRPAAPPAVIKIAGDDQNRPETYKGRTLAQWTDAIERSPNDPQLYFDRGRLHQIRDERTNAVDDFSQAISLKPDFLSAYLKRSEMYCMLADYKNAAADAGKAISLDSTSAEAYENRAFLNLSTEQYGPAVADYKKALELGGDSNNNYGVARSLYKLCRFNEALEWSAKTDLREPFYAGMAAMIATAKHDLPTANKFVQVTKSDPRAAEWAAVGFYEAAIGDVNGIEQSVAEIKSVDTFPARAYRFAGEVYRVAGMNEKAIQEYSASTSLEEYPPGRRERALSYIALGQWRTAYNDLKRSLSLSPDSSTTLSYLAFVEDKLGMKTEAKTHMEAAFKSSTLFPPIVFVNRAEVESNNGDAKGALRDLNQALAIDPWLKEAYDLRARIYDLQGQKSSADADRKQATALIPHLDL